MYMAPERLRGEAYSFPSDVWSVGMVLATLALGHFPYSVTEGFFGLEDAVVRLRILLYYFKNHVGK